MEDYISIGKMAEINHTTIATLRLYDRKKLLIPKYTDPKTGYRYYSLNQSYRFDMITYMKDLGMSLSEIEDIFNRKDNRVIEDILSRKNEQLHQQMRMLKARHNAVERAISSIERCRKSPVPGTITLEYIDRRNFWGMPATSDFYEKGIENYQQQVAELREKLIEKGAIQVHSYNVCTTIEKSLFLEDRFLPKLLFLIVDSNFEYKNETSILDSGMYACIYLNNFDDEIPYARMLREHCRKNHYHIIGDYICEVMSEFQVFETDQSSMYLKLQVPVSF